MRNSRDLTPQPPSLKGRGDSAQSQRSPRAVWWGVVWLVGIVVIAVAACGGSDPAAAPVPRPPELADGALDVGSDISYAPIDFFKAGTTEPDGLDMDIARALAANLGVQARIQYITFDDIIARLNARSFDVLLSAMSITPERQKDIDFVPYFIAGTGILVPRGNPKQVKSFNGLCGLRVAVQFQSVQVDQLKAINDGACKGNPAAIQTFETNPQSVDALKVGRADAQVADSPVTLYDAQQSQGLLEAVDAIHEPLPYGIGVRKGSTELKAALETALKGIIADGGYGRILARWGLSSGSVR